MNKVTIVNLNGRAFQVEEQAYEALREYLEESADRLADDPDCVEIMSDLEQAIGDKGARVLGEGKNVLSETDMRRILDQMGPVEPGANAESAKPAAAGTATPRETTGPKRLYRIEEGEMVAGVCNGLAAYFGMDPTIVRIVFVALLVLSSGFFGIAYLVFMFIVPVAKTPEERAAARGLPFNAQELVEQTKKHYAQAKESHQRWREKRRREKDRKFWKPKHQDGYEPPHSRPFEQPQSGYGARVAAGIALPLIGVISAALTVAALVVLLSLVATGEILGWPLPVDVPAWVAILALVAAWVIIAAPLRAVRYASYQAFGPRRGWFVFWDGVLWIVLVVIAWYFAARYVPGVADFMQHLAHNWRDIPFDLSR